MKLFLDFKGARTEVQVADGATVGELGSAVAAALKLEAASLTLLHPAVKGGLRPWRDLDASLASKGAPIRGGALALLT